jgi:hypothetical protein
VWLLEGVPGAGFDALAGDDQRGTGFEGLLTAAGDDGL